MNIYRSTMIFKRLFAWAFIFGILISGYSQIIPDQMEYCGMKLSFTPAAKQRLEEYINKIFENPRYYNQMVMKANTYMPIIEEAFNNVDIPEDLKYIAIQESGLRADATSISKTVGFWQISEELALNLGLEVNEQVDERMHIYRSSHAVASRLANMYPSFDNWVYTTIAYHEGVLNTTPHTNPQYYGQSFMMIDENLHWYVLKVIAYKIAYEEALNMTKKPNLWLEPVLAKGGSSIKKVYKGKEIDIEEFFAYNLWLKSTDKLPEEGYFTVYLPQKKDTYQGYIKDPVYEIESLTSIETEISPTSPSLNEQNTQIVPVKNNQEQDTRNIPLMNSVEAKSISELDSNRYVLFEIKYDIDYGTEFIEYDANFSLLETANRLGIGFNHLLTTNSLGPNEKPEDGRILYLIKPAKAQYHIVQAGENLAQIGFQHAKAISFLQERNQMEPHDFSIFIGQKLYLKKKKPKTEKMIILKGKILNNQEPISILLKKKQEPEIEESQDVNPPQTYSTSQKSEISYPVNNAISGDNETVSKWIEHEVSKGETLEEIAHQYNTSVEIVKQINKLESNYIAPGVTLRILIRK